MIEYGYSLFINNTNSSIMFKDEETCDFILNIFKKINDIFTKNSLEIFNSFLDIYDEDDIGFIDFSFSLLVSFA